MATQYPRRRRWDGRESGGPGLASTMVTGGGGVQLHVLEAGNPSGRPILFIHGMSQCWLTWSRQLRSTWPTTSGWSPWICAATVSRRSPARATPTPGCGLMTSTR